jgi:MFS transporter, ACS family, glucarate transporter
MFLRGCNVHRNMPLGCISLAIRNRPTLIAVRNTALIAPHFERSRRYSAKRVDWRLQDPKSLFFGRQLLMSNRPAVHNRWIMLFLLTCFTTIGYVERVNLTVAARSIREEFHLSDTQIGFSFSVFLVAYTMGQVPAGLLVDRFGSRRVLATAGLLWFLVTMGLALAAGEFSTTGAQVLASLLIGRFCLGLVEAPTYPGTSAAIRRWFSPDRRGLPNATTQSSSYIGEALTLAILGTITAYWGWRYALYASALPALLVAFAMWRWAADGPKNRSKYDEDFLEDGGDRPLTRGDVAGDLKWQLFHLSLSYGFHGYVSYLFFFWFYIYLVDERGFTLGAGGVVGALPSIAAAVCTLVGGQLCDRAVNKDNPLSGKIKIIMLSGLIGAIAILIGAFAHNIWLSVAGFIASVGTRGFVEGAYWSILSHIGGERTGLFGGVMNMAANFAGIVSTVMAPLLIKQLGWGGAMAAAALACALTSLSICRMFRAAVKTKF